MNAAGERDAAGGLAPRDWAGAYRRAAAIGDPWYRAQALGWVARFAPAAEVARLAEEAVAAAAEAAEPYQRLGACAWPVRALAERGERERAAVLLARLLPTAPGIENPANRADALVLLWEAAFPLGSAIRGQVLRALLAAARGAASWRAQRALRDVALMLPPEERAAADEVAAALPEGKYRRSTARRLAAGERRAPRPFFWEREHAT